MVLKKIVWASLSAALMCSAHALRDSEKIFGNISKAQFHHFLSGAAIGLTHGAVNQILRRTDNDRALGSVITYVTACQLQEAYGASKQGNNPTTWGRAIGQLIAESVVIDGQQGISLDMHMNLSLLIAAYEALHT